MRGCMSMSLLDQCQRVTTRPAKLHMQLWTQQVLTSIQGTVRIKFCVGAGYHSLLLCRMVVGLGEASFVSLASPLIGINTLGQPVTTALLAISHDCH